MRAEAVAQGLLDAEPLRLVAGDRVFEAEAAVREVVGVYPLGDISVAVGGLRAPLDQDSAFGVHGSYDSAVVVQHTFRPARTPHLTVRPRQQRARYPAARLRLPGRRPSDGPPRPGERHPTRHARRGGPRHRHRRRRLGRALRLRGDGQPDRRILAPTHPGHEATGERCYTGTRITRAGRVRYEHDALGRITSRRRTRLSNKPETWRYTWDAEDRPSSVLTPDGTRWHYRYDPLGRRIAKQDPGF
ncbi:hypothetical protein B1H18_11300 [Streptomyces tsukubensis]|uniref:RHS repeat protein n=1 Tax=Streptomyces tsukubensis TaxID=83656 RepID=A0A1V4ACJ8_9ACTN|nr:hypothetical protein B1H18_11300 [Streptomyces tsukubensis]